MMTLLKIKDGELKGWILAKGLCELRQRIEDCFDEDARYVLPELEDQPERGKTILSNGLILLNEIG